MIDWLGAASPFQTWADFEGAKDGSTQGAIYTFADRPVLIVALLVVAALVFLYFIYYTFTLKNGKSHAHNPAVLSLLIAASTVSLASSLYNIYADNNRQQASQAVSRPVTNATRKLPLALMGLVGVGKTATRQRTKRNRSRKKVRHYRSRNERRHL